MAVIRWALGAGFRGLTSVHQCPVVARLWWGESKFLLQQGERWPQEVKTPFAVLQELVKAHGPAVGLIAYDMAPWLGTGLQVPQGTNPLPPFYWVVPQWERGERTGPAGDFSCQPPWRCSLSCEEYRRGVEAIRQAIGQGDVYQVNLTRRWEVGFSGDPAGLFTTLCGDSPPRFAFFLQDQELGFSVLGLSPELFVATKGAEVESWPIKGTWSVPPEGEVGEKEQAELAMIVDLVRHDLGRVAVPASVEVVHPSRPVVTRDVVHREAVVRARLRPGVQWQGLLAATFPGGSVTGAPKIAACRLIAQLEPVARGVYCGAYGVLQPNGDVLLAMPIRTGYVSGGRLYVHSGAGIVWDSQASAEEQETRDKLASWFASVGVWP
ncbi:MAG: anthranilate synthase component I family protein [Thermoanaerobaculum sp.]|nr:anthranilate synthase component I family protein [Thermoanaerobaculum sp.]